MTGFACDSVFNIDENSIKDFRDSALSPAAILQGLNQHNANYLNGVPGVGKTEAIKRLACDPQTYAMFKAVLVIAPTKRIIEDNALAAIETNPVVPFAYLKARPEDRCGELDAPWKRYEKRGLTALGKDELCKACPNNTGDTPCPWPRPLSEKIEQSKLILATEAYFLEVTNLVTTVSKRSPGDDRPVLVILDEASFINTPFQVKIARIELINFRKVLMDMVHAGQLRENESVSIWTDSLTALLASDRMTLRHLKKHFPIELNTNAANIQREGVKAHKNFRYLGYLLPDFGKAQWDEQAIDDEEALVFIRRPELDATLLIFNGFHLADYLERKLKLPRLFTPLENFTVRHSKTRIVNIREACGADRHFQGSIKRVLNFYIPKIIQNIEGGRTTLLVGKKKRKPEVARLLTKKLKQLGYDVTVVSIEEELNRLGPPLPTVIPLIHYGAIGTNSFEHYQSAFCVQSYNIRPDQLEDLLYDGQPRENEKPRLDIRVNDQSVREVFVHDAEGEKQKLGCKLLIQLEIAVILQTVARVRFYTQPREVFLFQQADMAFNIGPDVVEYMALEDARIGEKVPDAHELKRRIIVARVQPLLSKGKSVRAAAKLTGFNKNSICALLECGRLTYPISSASLAG